MSRYKVLCFHNHYNRDVFTGRQVRNPRDRRGTSKHIESLVWYIMEHLVLDYMVGKRLEGISVTTTGLPSDIYHWIYHSLRDQTSYEGVCGNGIELRGLRDARYSWGVQWGPTMRLFEFSFLEGLTVDMYGILCFHGCSPDTTVNFFMTISWTVHECGK